MAGAWAAGAGAAGAGVPCPPWPFGSGWTAAEAGWTGTSGPLRGRRLVAEADTPYPTRTGRRPSCFGSSAGSAGACGAAAPPPPTSTAMIDVPTSTVVPSGKCSACTTPS
ncbi:hypothetical protein GCM10020295_40780 [Streptomyces cinereospinus]